MKKTSAFLVALAASLTLGLWADVGDLRITEVNPETTQVEVTNTGTSSWTTPTDLPFCHRLDCTSSIPSSTEFASGESRVFTITGLNPTDSDLWLYRDSDFENPASIVSGLKYGPEANVGRTSVAQAAGIWPSTTAYVPAPPSGDSLRVIAYDPTKPESWGSGTPSLGSFFGTGTQVANPLPGIRKGAAVIELQTVAEGLVSPLGMAAPEDGTGRLFLYDQAGEILVLQGGVVLPKPFLDVKNRLVALRQNYDERGLLGLALHPNFAANGKLYTYTSEPVAGPADFTTPGGVRDHQSVVAEWKVDATDPNVVDLSNRRELLRIDEPQSNHNGGDMSFGPDGMLYIALGDGGAADDQGGGHSPQGNAQDITNVFGKILRIDVDGTNSANGNYGVPADNPFVGKPGVDEIFAYGFRNPYRFSFDRGAGKLYVGDVGQNALEEIDIVSNRGNYGWRLKESSFFFDANADGPGFPTTLPVAAVPRDVADPIAEYDHDDGKAVIGGFVYRGKALPSLTGLYVCADWGDFQTPSGRMFYIDKAGKFAEFQIGQPDRPLGLWVKGFAQDQDGELYILGSQVLGPSGTTGKVLKIVPPAKFEVTALSTGASGVRIEFVSAYPAEGHRVEARPSLVGGTGWAEIPALVEHLGGGQFLAVFAPSGDPMEFYRVTFVQ